MTDEPTTEEDERWCREQRDQVLAYLSSEGFNCPAVGEWPAWHVTPLVSVWAVESLVDPERVGWWAVSGDFPTDFTTCSGERHPRQALRDIGQRWRDAAVKWANGEPADGWGLRNGEPDSELAKLLATRAELFFEIAADDSYWRD